MRQKHIHPVQGWISNEAKQHLPSGYILNDNFDPTEAIYTAKDYAGLFLTYHMGDI